MNKQISYTDEYTVNEIAAATNTLNFRIGAPKFKNDKKKDREEEANRQVIDVPDNSQKDLR